MGINKITNVLTIFVIVLLSLGADTFSEDRRGDADVYITTDGVVRPYLRFFEGMKGSAGVKAYMLPSEQGSFEFVAVGESRERVSIALWSIPVKSADSVPSKARRLHAQGNGGASFIVPHQENGKYILSVNAPSLGEDMGGVTFSVFDKNEHTYRSLLNRYPEDCLSEFSFNKQFAFAMSSKGINAPIVYQVKDRVGNDNTGITLSVIPIRDGFYNIVAKDDNGGDIEMWIMRINGNQYLGFDNGEGQCGLTLPFSEKGRYYVEIHNSMDDEFVVGYKIR